MNIHDFACEYPARAALRERFGPGRRLPDDIEDEVIVITWDGDKEAAEFAAAGNREFFDHPSHAELRESVGWVTICDLRPAIARSRTSRL